MSAILFSPHNDDETLFSFYSMLRHKADLIVVLRSYKQWTLQNGPNYETREAETLCAATIAGVDYMQWTAYTDVNPDWPSIADFVALAIRERGPNVVIAPAWEMGGHEDHNALASIVGGIPGDFERINYLAYVRGHGRSQSEHEIVATPEEQELKQEALLCYESQRKHLATADWFPGGGYSDLREWVA